MSYWEEKELQGATVKKKIGVWEHEDIKISKKRGSTSLDKWVGVDASMRDWVQQVQCKNYVSKLEPMREDGSDMEILKEVEFGR